MYLGGYELSDICLKLNIETDTARFFIFGIDGTGKDPTCLYSIKTKMNSAAIGTYLVDKVSNLERTSGIALNILTNALVSLKGDVDSGEVKLSVSDLKQLSSIVTDLDKMIRLESGLATETITHIGLTTAEAREVLASDPFAEDIVDAEYSSLPWLNEGKDGQ